MRSDISLKFASSFSCIGLKKDGGREGVGVLSESERETDRGRSFSLP